jgi:hypothetical protein
VQQIVWGKRLDIAREIHKTCEKRILSTLNYFRVFRVFRVSIISMSSEKSSARSTLWIILSLIIFVAVELLLGGIIGPLLVGRFVSQPLYLKLQMILMLGSYFLGGLLIGLLSPGIRVLEPAIGAALAVIFTWLYSFFTPIRFYGFSLTRMIIGGGIAFVLALIGADLGERIAAKLGNRQSKDYASK